MRRHRFLSGVVDSYEAALVLMRRRWFYGCGSVEFRRSFFFSAALLLATHWQSANSGAKRQTTSASGGKEEEADRMRNRTFFLISFLTFIKASAHLYIGCPKKNVPLYRKYVRLVQRTTSYLDTAQQDFFMGRRNVWDTR